METLRLSDFFVPEIPRIVPEIRGIVPEIPGEQFSHIREFSKYTICVAFALCTVFPEMSSFCKPLLPFLPEKPLVSKIFATWCF